MTIAIAVAYLLSFLLVATTLMRIGGRSIAFALLMLTVLCSLWALNSEYDFLAEKLSSFLSWDMHRGERFSLTFVVQYALALPAMIFFEHQYAAHALNLSLQALTFALIFTYLFRERLTPWLLLLLAYPAYYHYAIFGLRDPLINLVSVLFVIAAIHLPRRQFYVACLSMSALCLGIRPEYSLILIGFIGVRLYFISGRKGRVRLVLLGMFSLYAALLLMPLSLGLPTSWSAPRNLQLIGEFNTARAMRHIGSIGGGSHILGGTLYELPLPIRYPIQVVASFIAPLPFEIRGGAHLFAFAESVLFTTLAVFAWIRSRALALPRYLVVCGLLYMLLQAFFMNNYGNLIRVRYPAYVFFLAGVCLPMLAASGNLSRAGQRMTAPRRRVAAR